MSSEGRIDANQTTNDKDRTMNLNNSMTALLLRASDNYTVLAARHTHDEDGFAYFEVETASGEAIAEVALWREDASLETTEGWCELSLEADRALDADDALGSDGVLNSTAIHTSILNACLDADEAR
jgi:hypothetical protein